MKAPDPFRLKGKHGLKFLHWMLKDQGVSDPMAIVNIAFRNTKWVEGNCQPGMEDATLLAMQKRWYESEGNWDYSVYGEDSYLAEVWTCWDFYARRSIQQIFDRKHLQPDGLLPLMGDGILVDVGNGIGLSTAALKTLFPLRRVIGTNIKGTTQWRINQRMSELYGFELMTNDDLLQNVKDSVSTVFASEYFEHFESPIDHLKEMAALNPNCWVVANAFGATAIGHFNSYKVDNEMIPDKAVGRIFGKTMRELGWESVKTKLWNNRPSVWLRA